MSFLKTRTRIVQLAIAMVALAAMTLGGTFTAQAGGAAGTFNPVTGDATYSDSGVNCASIPAQAGPPPVPGSFQLVPVGNGAWGGILPCNDGSFAAVTVLPTSPTGGIIVGAIHGATAITSYDNS